MAAEDKPCAEFSHMEIDSLTQNGLKGDKPQCSATLRKCYALCRRKTFALYVASKREGSSTSSSSASSSSSSSSWCCCGQTFQEASSIHRHVARTHEAEIRRRADSTFEQLLIRLEAEAEPEPQPPGQEEPQDVSAWIPDTGHLTEQQLQKGPGRVLLYYCYRQVEDPHVICAWQKALCEKLHLTGKVRVATEGVNGTVGGTEVATDMYIKAMRSHPLFSIMEDEDFKTSAGSAECFPELKVGVYREIVPMGVDPDVISYRLAGVHLEPEDFHREVEALLSKGDSCNDTILLDCRNFYESKIGQFSRCLAPDIRKFSYFPDYVDQNLELFRDKKVLMYCTGGIRCERGSAYLRSKDVCKEVYQLKGGIHKYLERFPEGFYRGKLFVFDERYAISSNDDIISDCRYCGAPWDHYQLCSTHFCCQLVLSCPVCRQDGHTACCPTCQTKGRAQSDESTPAPPHREECECTVQRPRIPQEVQ